MRDLHYDAGFARDFNAASTAWTWASWHQVKDERDAAALRLLQQVFGEPDDPTTTVDREEDITE
ncbi:MAG TPA: hypothetical protein VKT52_05175 [Ktedonobacterales bacterium]|nr:hypothetical protein [Ktedonobacterales bacterium]